MPKKSRTSTLNKTVQIEETFSKRLNSNEQGIQVLSSETSPQCQSSGILIFEDDKPKTSLEAFKGK